MQNKIIIILVLLSFLFIAGRIFIASSQNEFILERTALKDTIEFNLKDYSKYLVVIDPGHGGYDPGLVIEDGDDIIVKESDLNLEIAYKLKESLEKNNVKVVLTRSKDKSLGRSKMKDLKNRIEFTEKYDADLFLSIHQDRFDDESIRGAQIYYDRDSLSSKILATELQNNLKSFDRLNSREELATKSVYILNNKADTSILIECGFLSNTNERNKLMDDSYQTKLADTISDTIIDFFDQQEENIKKKTSGPNNTY